VLATRFGLRAIDAVHNGEWGQMAALHGTAIEMVPLEEAVGTLKTVPEDYYREATVFFG
jgi:6-phosphofructokinase